MLVSVCCGVGACCLGNCCLHACTRAPPSRCLMHQCLKCQLAPHKGNVCSGSDTTPYSHTVPGSSPTHTYCFAASPASSLACLLTVLPPHCSADSQAISQMGPPRSHPAPHAESYTSAHVVRTCSPLSPGRRGTPTRCTRSSTSPSTARELPATGRHSAYWTRTSVRCLMRLGRWRRGGP